MKFRDFKRKVNKPPLFGGDVAVFLHKKEEKEYFKKEYFLAAIEKWI